MKKLPLLCLGLLAGCTVGPNYGGAPRVASDAVTRGTFVRAQDPAFNAAPGLTRWWEALGDPTLTALVDDALAHSPQIDRAQATIREARAQLRTQQVNQLPSVSASASYLHAKIPDVNIAGTSGSAQGGTSTNTSFDFYNLGGTASWEPDLFGGGRRGAESARATVAERFADLADAQVSLSAEVAQAYVNLRDVQHRAALNAQSTKLQTQALALTRQRYAAGTATALDVERLQNQLNQTDAQNLPLGAQIDEYRNQLAVLTGRAPGALDATLVVVVPVPLPPASVPISDPGTLIAHRPDVRSAERALAAGTAQIGVQTAKMYPRISFTGILGLGGTAIGDVVNPNKFTALLAPQLSWSFLDFGRNRAMVRQAQAQRDEAEAQYRQTVLSALQDAENSLSQFGNRRQQLAQLVEAERSAQRSAQLNALRVQAGTSTVTDQLDIERQRYAATISVAQATAQLTNSYIAVQKALGLGWSDPSAAAAR
ncbi:efflux transporter outer membrane subunit [Sphingomonas nostoxanthinifaciens]|uniref:efflux transporter outer membrane subunit n=1 Tax=Sphingomonas nostoxanthinifaciens TaxID=2872652 RepID=UPI001CC20413|nr:efflux transporter outer membrane subunit [Sphingomonas nostoxanthinifaciens]UAK23105.1 efflux transporter outer membrane subunit [Sphingomonas nostoxanthinifaciens]